MYLTGADGQRSGEYAHENLIALLLDRLNTAPTSEPFAPFGGVLVTGDYAEAEKWFEAAKRPFVFVDEADWEEDTSANWGKKVDGVYHAARRFNIEISLEIVTNPYCAPAEGPLKTALRAVLQAALSDLVALAMEEVEVKAGQGRVVKPGRRNPHTFSCGILALIA